MKSPTGRNEHVESALLLLARDPRGLADALSLLCTRAELQSHARSLGRRRKGRPDPALVVVEGLIADPRFRRSFATRLVELLPELPESLDRSLFEREDLVPFLRPELLLGALREDLRGAEPEDWERAGARLRAWSPILPQPRDEPALTAGDSPPEPLPEAEDPLPLPPTDPARIARFRAEKERLQEQLQELRKERARLEQALATERQRRAELREELAESRDQAQASARRATELKRLLQGANSASERERGLARELEEAQHALRIAEQRNEILAMERDDLRGVLEDYDRFLDFEEEDVPAFRDRPLPREEQDLAALLEEARRAGRAIPRILVVGGGEPQLRHRDKFEEYAQVLGFRGEWRMAEYSSWHHEMDRLKREMQSRFDALVILHWNRTTFTRNAREICNQQGQKPCITCHYEGFVSLRQTLQECLRQVLSRT